MSIIPLGFSGDGNGRVVTFGFGGGSTPPPTLTAYPDPFAATSTSTGPSPLSATSTSTGPDPLAATSRLLGS